MTADREQAVVLITGIQAAGKSTVAQLLAERLPCSVHLRGDLYRRMIVSGRADITPELTDDAAAQLQLRYRLTASAADAYFRAGFTVIAQDVILGDHLRDMTTMITSRPLLLVVLTADTTTIEAREAGRHKNAYRDWTPAGLEKILHDETPRLGLWLDTTRQSPAETVDEILARAWTSARIG
jgi:chloramphenicol 3-O-phosphotransferase